MAPDFLFNQNPSLDVIRLELGEDKTKSIKYHPETTVSMSDILHFCLMHVKLFSVGGGPRFPKVISSVTAKTGAPILTGNHRVVKVQAQSQNSHGRH